MQASDTQVNNKPAIAWTIADKRRESAHVWLSEIAVSS